MMYIISKSTQTQIYKGMPKGCCPWAFTFEMNSLKDYIICEGIDEENLAYKIDLWFAKDYDSKQKFYDVVRNFNTPGKKYDTNEFNKYIENSKLNLKNFIDFMTDDISYNEINDYLYVFQKIVGLLGANKQIMGN